MLETLDFLVAVLNDIMVKDLHETVLLVPGLLRLQNNNQIITEKSLIALDVLFKIIGNDLKGF